MQSLKRFIKKYKVGEFGMVIPGLVINGKVAPYPVLNERAVRAGAGITFAVGMFAFFQAFYFENFLYLQYMVAVLFLDFFIKVIVGPHYSPLSLLASWIVKNQTPEYVGAIQKRFAWSIGLFLATVMLFLLFVFSVTGLVSLLICGVCLLFMFFESAFGICVGCKIYSGLVSYGLVPAPKHKPACAGNVCDIT